MWHHNSCPRLYSLGPLCYRRLNPRACNHTAILKIAGRVNGILDYVWYGKESMFGMELIDNNLDSPVGPTRISTFPPSHRIFKTKEGWFPLFVPNYHLIVICRRCSHNRVRLGVFRFIPVVLFMARHDVAIPTLSKHGSRVPHRIWRVAATFVVIERHV